MNHADSVAVQVALSVIFVVLTAYTAGRMHQWYRHSLERDVAYREGYNQASRSLFHLAVRTRPGKPPAPPVTDPARPPRTVVPQRGGTTPDPARNRRSRSEPR